MSPLIATAEWTNLWFITDYVKHVTSAKLIYQKVENAWNKIAQETSLSNERNNKRNYHAVPKAGWLNHVSTPLSQVQWKHSL